MFDGAFLQTQMSDIARQLEEQAEASLMKQLNWFIERDLILIKRGETILTKDNYSNKIKLSSMVELELKDKEYIESLELEVKQLKAKIEILTKGDA